MKFKTNKGFTLIEVLLVIGIIAILASVVIIAINPLRQLAAARNAQRAMNINAIHKALLQYTVAHGSLPTTVGSSSMEICRSNATDCTGLVDLSVLYNNAEYMTALPIDPSVSSANSTGYMVYKTAAGRPVVYAPLAELGEVINTSNNSSNVKCTPNCSGKVCGNDGCGGTCGTCSGSTPICKSDFSACVAANPCNDTASASQECNSSSAYGTVCGGGTLLCKSDNAACGGANIVVAPSNCTNSTTCNCGTDTITKVWDNSGVNAIETSPYTAISLDNGLNNLNGHNPSSIYEAAKFCADLNINGFSDWYLPSRYELCAMVRSGSRCSSLSYTCIAGNEQSAGSAPLNSCTNASPLISGFSNGYYKSSTESAATTAWAQAANTGFESDSGKSGSGYVRCIRRF